MLDSPPYSIGQRKKFQLPKTVRILSIDGGGVRGLIPALLLAELERLAARPIASLFDLIAGTSTGGILALGLVKPSSSGGPQYSAADMAKLYETQASQIFGRPFLHKLQSLGSVAEQKYPTKGIENVLANYFGDARLHQCLTDVLIPSYEIERGFPFFFKSTNARTRNGYDFAMRDVARATSAAPTYFEPCKLAAETEGDYFALIDGGVFANNPAMCALVEARTCNPDACTFIVVSLGTGVQKEPLLYEKAKNWGLAQWAKPVFNVVLDGGSQTVDYQLGALSDSAGRTSYYRFQPQLSDATRAMDNTAPTNLRRLRLLADGLIGEHKAELKHLAQQLSAPAQ